MQQMAAARAILKHAKSLPSPSPLGTGSWADVIADQLRSHKTSSTADLDTSASETAGSHDPEACASHVAGMIAETTELKRLMYEFGGETKMTQRERMQNVANFVGLGIPKPK